MLDLNVKQIKGNKYTCHSMWHHQLGLSPERIRSVIRLFDMELSFFRSVIDINKLLLGSRPCMVAIKFMFI